jgi:hypothetical protein
MADLCNTFDELRAEIAKAQRWLSRADEAVSEQILDEGYSDGTANPGAHELQRQAEQHLEGLQRQFQRLLEQLEAANG